MKLHSRIYGWKYVWMEFAEEFKASVDDPNPDSSHTRMSISVPITDTGWVLVYTMVPKGMAKNDQTAIDVEYKANGNFKFAIHPQNWLDGFGKLLGMQDIVVGQPEFDKHFIVKSNDEKLVKQYFKDTVLAKQLLDEPTIQLWANCDNEEHSTVRATTAGCTRLCLRVQGAVDDFERLKQFYRLKHRALHNLVQIGAAVH